MSCDPDRLDLGVIHGFLSRSYWAEGMPLAVLKRAIENSLCFGLYAGDAQIGFARVITDRATFAYLSDVFVLESHRGRGLAKWLVETIRSHPDLQGLRRFVLVTRDAHGLYEPLGFGALRAPQHYLERVERDVYRRTAGAERTEDVSEPEEAEGMLTMASLSERPGLEPEPTAHVRESGIGSRFRVHALAAGEGRLLKELRLAALGDAPQTFGERWEDANARSDEQWEEQAQALAEPEGPRLFVVDLDGEPAGLALAVEDPSDPDVLRVGGMWVAPFARRRGAARCLLEAALDCARTRDKRWLRLWVHNDLAGARACYEAFGFVYDGAKKPFPRDPNRELLSMQLRVAPLPEPARAHS